MPWYFSELIVIWEIKAITFYNNLKVVWVDCYLGTIGVTTYSIGRFEVALEQNYGFEVWVEKGLTESIDSKSLEGSST